MTERGRRWWMSDTGKETLREVCQREMIASARGIEPRRAFDRCREPRRTSLVVLGRKDPRLGKQPSQLDRQITPVVAGRQYPTRVACGGFGRPRTSSARAGTRAIRRTRRTRHGMRWIMGRFEQSQIEQRGRDAAVLHPGVATAGLRWRGRNGIHGREQQAMSRPMNLPSASGKRPSSRRVAPSTGPLRM